MKISVKLMSTYLLVMGMLCSFVFSARAEDVMVQVEKEMPVLKGDTWIKMSDDEKISFIWGAGHIVSIEEVLARDNPDLKKSNTFVNRIMEAHNKKPMTMSQVAKYVDDYYQANPDKLDKPVIEVIWYGTIVPRTTTTDESGKSAK
jgi:hypothetical protein